MTTVASLGRIYKPDARDHNYLLKTVLPPTPRRVLSRRYKTGPVLDQGATSSCVGHGWRSWISSELEMDARGPDAFSIYAAAQSLDGWPLPHDGSTVRAGAQALQAVGFITNYGWAFDGATVRDWIVRGQGTVVVGTNWHADMFSPNGAGLIQATGDVVGGHCYLITGYSARKRLFRVMNSWGEGWGVKGFAFIAFNDMDRLIRDHGEACSAIQKPVTP